ncbi:hypothetical protein BV20DRAFT_538472 [Pilatotrama ljubarskyi]|nr:hypothetical protein BV20DRAFT_538472 [Pilatotrama ljubarskyi]
MTNTPHSAGEAANWHMPRDPICQRATSRWTGLRVQTQRSRLGKSTASLSAFEEGLHLAPKEEAKALNSSGAVSPYHRGTEHASPSRRLHPRSILITPVKLPKYYNGAGKGAVPGACQDQQYLERTERHSHVDAGLQRHSASYTPETQYSDSNSCRRASGAC